MNPRRDLVGLLPGMVPNAPKRNVLVGYIYLFVTVALLAIVQHV